MSVSNHSSSPGAVASPFSRSAASLKSTPSTFPGLAFAAAIGAVAYGLGVYLPVLGAPVVSILLGIAIRNLVGVPAGFLPGVSMAGKKVLQGGIILLGGGLSLVQIWKAGSDSFVVMIVTLVVGILGAMLAGKLLGVSWRLASLVSVGTGICGASAIAAVAPIVEADDNEVAYSLSTIFLFNIAAVFLFPIVGRALGLSTESYGLWAGTSVNDTSSVLATAYAYMDASVPVATVVKLARATMIVPVALLFAAWVGMRNRAESNKTVSISTIVPWFVIGFLAMAVVNSLGLFPAPVDKWLTVGGKISITIALAGVGLGVDLKEFAKTGFRPLFLGFLAWILVAVTGLATQWVSGIL